MGRLMTLVRRLRKTGAPGEPAPTDHQCLEQFLAKRDQDAFDVLVRRHGPMVLGVCRRVLGHAADAEDAFQAVFLVLVRKAGSLSSRELLANWLYGVAYRTALKTRTMNARRRARVQPVPNLPEPEVAPPDTSENAQPILDEELSRLPDKYRLPIIL